MTWLALKILGYLLAAFLIGTVAGWMLTKLADRDRLHTRLAQAAAEIAELRRQQVPRPAGSDASTHAVVDAQAEMIPEGDAAEIRPRKNGVVSDQERLNGKKGIRLPNDERLAGLQSEIAQLRQQLVEANEANRPNTALELTIKELEGRLVRKMAEIDRLQRALNSEGRKVVELERERELQNKSLLVLHQQLQMKRNPQCSSG